MLQRASMLRYHSLWNASAQSEGGICQFSLIRAKIGYHSNVPLEIAKRKEGWIDHAHACVGLHILKMC